MPSIAHSLAICCLLFQSAFCLSQQPASQHPTGKIMTVTGRIPADRLGKSLAHEHIVTNFIGAAAAVPAPFDTAHALPLVLPRLTALRENGFRSLVECTPAYIGRDVRLLKLLSETAKLHIITNTGYYAAVDKKYLPGHVFTETARKISRRWITEYRRGIEGTGIRPGFIKLGVGSGPLDSVEAKLLEAGILASQKTGLTIAVHTGDDAAALDEVRLLEAARLPLHKLIWVHAQNGTDETRAQLAAKGVWISLDGVSENSLDKYLSMILYLRNRGLLPRLLLSHDDGWAVPENGSYRGLTLFGNGNNRPYQTIPRQLIPLLREKGFTEAELELVFILNPARALQLGK